MKKFVTSLLLAGLVLVSGAAAAHAQRTNVIPSVGSLTVVYSPADPYYAVYPAGSTGVTLGAFTFTANNENIRLEKIGFILANTFSSSPNDFSNGSLWANGRKVGTVVFNSFSYTATTTLFSPIVLVKNAPNSIVIKGDLNPITLGGPVSISGHLIKVNVNRDDTTGTQGTGLSSGYTINLATAGSSVINNSSNRGVRVFKSVPTFTQFGLANWPRALYRLTVAASPTGPIELNKLTFNLGTSSATIVGNPIFVGPNGTVASTSANAVIMNGAGTQFTVFFDNPANIADRFIPAGSSRVYTFRSMVALSGPGGAGSIVVGLKADAAYPSSASFMGTVAGLQSAGTNDIWSPLSTTTAVSTSDLDWTNGYLSPQNSCFSSIGRDCPLVLVAGGSHPITPVTPRLATPTVKGNTVSLSWWPVQPLNQGWTYEVWRRGGGFAITARDIVNATAANGGSLPWCQNTVNNSQALCDAGNVISDNNLGDTTAKRDGTYTYVVDLQTGLGGGDLVSNSKVVNVGSHFPNNTDLLPGSGHCTGRTSFWWDLDNNGNQIMSGSLVNGDPRILCYNNPTDTSVPVHAYSPGTGYFYSPTSDWGGNAYKVSPCVQKGTHFVNKAGTAWQTTKDQNCPATTASASATSQFASVLSSLKSVLEGMQASF